MIRRPPRSPLFPSTALFRSLSITGEPDELVAAAAQHAVTVHGHADAPELREQLRGLLADEPGVSAPRSEEHTSELQSQSNLVCRLLLDKKRQILPHTRRTLS